MTMVYKESQMKSQAVRILPGYHSHLKASLDYILDYLCFASCSALVLCFGDTT